MRAWRVLLLVAAAALGAVLGNDEVDTAGSATEPVTVEVEKAPLLAWSDFKKKPIKELKAFLATKGLECKGCSEKEDFVKLAFDNQEKPNVTAAPDADAKPAPQETSSEDLEEIMRKLQENSGAQFFRPGEFDGLTAEEISAKMRAKSRKPKAKAKKARKPSDTTSAEKEGEASKASDKEEKKKDGKAKKAKKESKPKESKPKESKPKESKPKESKPKKEAKPKAKKGGFNIHEEGSHQGHGHGREEAHNFDDAETIEL